LRRESIFFESRHVRRTSKVRRTVLVARSLHSWRVRERPQATARVVRGGSYFNNRRREACRSAYRNRNEPMNFNDNIGFRVAHSTFWVLAGSAHRLPGSRWPRLKMAGRFPAPSPPAPLPRTKGVRGRGE
jgi:hypothetical protein